MMSIRQFVVSVGESLLEEAILDVLFKAQNEGKEAMSVPDISGCTGIFSEANKTTTINNHAIAWGIIAKLLIQGRIVKPGSELTYALTPEEFDLRKRKEEA